MVIDEAQNFVSDLEQLVQWITPGLMDRRGRMFMLGTPGQEEKGYWYEVCNGQHKEWSFVQGIPYENPYTAPQMKEYVAQLRTANPRIEDTPFFKREILGEWVTDTRKNVITLDPEVNYLREWSPQPGDHYVLGVDFGDACTAFVVACWNQSAYPWIAIVDCSTLTGALISDLVSEMRRYQAKYQNLYIVADPGGVSKTIVRELTETHGLPLINAQKEERIASVNLLATDMSLGLIRIYNSQDPEHPERSLVSEQYQQMIWVEDRHTKKRVESDPHHLHDAVLYARRFCHKHLYSPPPPAPPAYGTKEYWSDEEKRIRADLSRRVEKRTRHSSDLMRGTLAGRVFKS